MSNVNSPLPVHRNGQHTKDDINKMLRPAKARDNIKAAFAGNENKGPARNQKKTSGLQDHSTNVKSRVTDASKAKTPKR